MARWLRFLLVALRSVGRPRLGPGDTSIVTARVWPTDADVSVANNAAYLILFDMARVDLQLRTGLSDRPIAVDGNWQGWTNITGHARRGTRDVSRRTVHAVHDRGVPAGREAVAGARQPQRRGPTWCSGTDPWAGLVSEESRLTQLTSREALSLAAASSAASACEPGALKRVSRDAPHFRRAVHGAMPLVRDTSVVVRGPSCHECEACTPRLFPRWHTPHPRSARTGPPLIPRIRRHHPSGSGRSSRPEVVRRCAFSASTVASTRQYGFGPRTRSESLDGTAYAAVMCTSGSAMRSAAAQSAPARTRWPCSAGAACRATGSASAARDARATSFGLQRPFDLVRVEEDAGRRCLRAHELECACRSSLRKEALPRAQQNRRDDQHSFVRKPMFEQRRRQRGAP
jgi:hypothetical protein